MDISQIITPEIKALNRIEFDRVFNLLSGQSIVISKIKNEIVTLLNHFNSMVEVLLSLPDQIGQLEKTLYDMHCQAFIHTIYMYLMFSNSEGEKYIKPVTPSSLTTDISITIKMPHYETTRLISTIDNISVNISTWDMYIGPTMFTAAKSSDLVQQFSVVDEIPNPYFSQSEFVKGVSLEVEKLLLFKSQLSRSEQIINAGLKYISELKNIGLYN